MDVLQALLELEKFPFQPKIETVSWSNCINRILAEDIIADQDFPPFNRVMMDGFALRFDDWQKGQRSFPIGGFVGAGDDPALAPLASCIEIMTGASIPFHFDVVVPIEKVEVQGDNMLISDHYLPERNQHIHERGSDYKKGDVLIAAGTEITPLQLAVITSCGYANVSVFKRPRIAIVSTGDELVAVEDHPLPFQIRMSNAHALQAMFQLHAESISTFHWRDDYEEMSKSMESMKDFEILIFTGGVSKGKKDFMPHLWAAHGFQKVVHGVKQKPGKPIWMGHNGGQVLFGLPGNPVSALTCAMVYVLPFVKAFTGNINHKSCVEVKTNVTQNDHLDLLVPVIFRQGSWEILKNNGSGDLIGFAQAQGIIRVPKKSQESLNGFLFDYFPAR